MINALFKFAGWNRNLKWQILLPSFVAAVTVRGAETDISAPPPYKQLRYDENYQYFEMDPKIRTVI